MKLYTLSSLSFIMALLTMPFLAQAETKDTPQLGIPLENRVEILESMVQNLQNLVTAQQVTIAGHGTNLNNLSNSINGQSGQITALQTNIGTLQNTVAGFNNTVNGLQGSIGQLAQNSVLALDGYLSLNGNTAMFDGVNVQIVNGLGLTESVNGTGNLIVGYDEAQDANNNDGPEICDNGDYINQTDCLANNGTWDSGQKVGSHNIVVGRAHSYTQYAGVVFGEKNAINNEYSTVTAGLRNVAAGKYTSVSGGISNLAAGHLSAINGGADNKTFSERSSINGGEDNETHGFLSSISGGEDNRATGHWSSVSGGKSNRAIGSWSSVSGGNLNFAEGFYSSISGGKSNEAHGDYSTISGGQNRYLNHLAHYAWAAGSLVEPN